MTRLEEFWVSSKHADARAAVVAMLTKQRTPAVSGLVREPQGLVEQDEPASLHEAPVNLLVLTHEHVGCETTDLVERGPAIDTSLDTAHVAPLATLRVDAATYAEPAGSGMRHSTAERRMPDLPRLATYTGKPRLVTGKYLRSTRKVVGCEHAMCVHARHQRCSSRTEPQVERLGRIQAPVLTEQLEARLDSLPFSDNIQGGVLGPGIDDEQTYPPRGIFLVQHRVEAGSDVGLLVECRDNDVDRGERLHSEAND